MSAGRCVSVIMPVWQPRLAWLEGAIRSALASDVVLELVLVDDGCDPPVVDSAPRDSRIRNVRIPHGGESAARNAGIAAAQGMFIRFADCDDLTQPGSLDRLVTRARGYDGIVFGDTQVCAPDLTPLRTIVSPLERPSAADCVVGRFHARAPSMLFPRSLALMVGSWETSMALCADWDWVLRALERAPAVREPGTVTIYRRHIGSTTGAAAVADGAAARARIVAAYFDRNPELAGTALEHAAWTALHVDSARAHAHARQWRAAARHALQLAALQARTRVRRSAAQA